MANKRVASHTWLWVNAGPNHAFTGGIRAEWETEVPFLKRNICFLTVRPVSCTVHIVSETAHSVPVCPGERWREECVSVLRRMPCVRFGIHTLSVLKWVFMCGLCCPRNTWAKIERQIAGLTRDNDMERPTKKALKSYISRIPTIIKWWKHIADSKIRVRKSTKLERNNPNSNAWNQIT